MFCFRMVCHYSSGVCHGLGPLFPLSSGVPGWIIFSIKNNRVPSSCVRMIHQRSPKPTFQNPNIFELSMFYYSSQIRKQKQKYGTVWNRHSDFHTLCFQRTRNRISKFLCFGKSLFNQKWKEKQAEGSNINVTFSAMYFDLVFLLISLTIFVFTLLILSHYENDKCILLPYNYSLFYEQWNISYMTLFGCYRLFKEM